MSSGTEGSRSSVSMYSSHVASPLFMCASGGDSRGSKGGHSSLHKNVVIITAEDEWDVTSVSSSVWWLELEEEIEATEHADRSFSENILCRVYVGISR